MHQAAHEGSGAENYGFCGNLHSEGGANAGDFAGINVIDLLLGLCFANEPSYSQMLVDKFLYMMPEDQQILRESMRMTSIMDDFLAAEAERDSEWLQTNLKLFIQVCKLHGDTAIGHHNQLVSKYIAQPSQQMQRVSLHSLRKLHYAP